MWKSIFIENRNHLKMEEKIPEKKLWQKELSMNAMTHGFIKLRIRADMKTKRSPMLNAIETTSNHRSEGYSWLVKKLERSGWFNGYVGGFCVL